MRMKPNRRLTRRDFLKLSGTVLQRSAALSLMMYLYGTDVETNWIEVTQVTLKLPRLDPAFHGLRLAQLSDFHVGHGMDAQRLEWILELALVERPEAFLLTGDFVDKYPRRMGTAESLAAVSACFSKLAAASPTFAVLGNHDHKVDGPGVEAALTSAGVQVLRNTRSTLMLDGRPLTIAGVDDIRERKDRLDLLLPQLPEDDSALLLVHEPDSADIMSATGRFAAQFSGHSHGGQLALPFLGPLYLPEWGRKYPQGLYRVGGMWLYTNRGIGVTSVNFRFNCRPEITVFTLESGN